MFADQFVAMYGYGYHLIRSFILMKFNFDNEDEINSYIQQMSKSNDIDFTNEHPMFLNRLYNIINQMKADYPYLDNPKTKQQLLNDLKQSKKLINKITHNHNSLLKQISDQKKEEANQERNTIDHIVQRRESRPKLTNLQMILHRQKSR